MRWLKVVLLSFVAVMMLSCHYWVLGKEGRKEAERKGRTKRDQGMIKADCFGTTVQLMFSRGRLFN